MHPTQLFLKTWLLFTTTSGRHKLKTVSGACHNHLVGAILPYLGGEIGSQQL